MTTRKPIKIIPIKALKHPLSEYARPSWIKAQGGIPVDASIYEDVKRLIEAGAITLASCCGHGRTLPVCLISKKSKNILEGLNYSFKETADCYEVNLNMSGNACRRG